MAIPTTLLAFHTERLQAIQASRTAQQDRLKDVQTNLLPAVRKQEKDLSDRTAALERDAADLRKQIAAAPTTADGEALLGLLEQKLIALRAAQSDIVAAKSRITVLEAELASLALTLAALSKSEGEEKSAVDASTKRAERIKKLQDALLAPPVSAVRTDASTALAAIAPADTRIKGDIPVDLLTRAQERRSAASDVLSKAVAAVPAATALGPGKLETALSRAENALSEYVGQAVSRLAAAKDSVTRVARPDVSPLTPAQKARINDTKVVDDGKAAAAKEKTRDDAFQDLSAKQVVLNDAILNARATDIDVDPSTVQAVIDATKDRDDAKTVLGTASTAYGAADRAAIDKWEAAVPEDTWRLANELEEARSTLTELKNLDPATLVTALGTAEAAWVADLVKAEKSVRAAAFVLAESKSRIAFAEFEKNVNPHRRFTGMRGDQQGA